MDGLLAGLRIVEGSAFVAAPLGGMTLAQLGADVIRFDDLGGGLDAGRWPVTVAGRSIYWASLNKGKRSLAVDLKSPRGRELVTALITASGPDAGIFSTNLPAGRGWLAYDTLAARRKDLIALNIIGAHDDTPQVDYTVNAVAGFPMITGPAGHDGPVNHVLPGWDIATGYAAAAAILAAERFRARTGKGQLVRLALQDVALAATAALGYLGEAEINRTDRERYGNDVFGTYIRDFTTRDGRHLVLCILTERQLDAVAKAGGFGEAFAALERRLGIDLREEGHRWRARGDITAIIAPWIASLTLAEAGEVLTRAGVLWGPYKRPSELVAGDPLVTGNPMFHRIAEPGIGTVWSAASPYDFKGAVRLPPKPAPELGQHTDEILSGILRLPDGEIGRLHDAKVVAGPRRD
jgi:2-methylfumaryl-CoA isomerase